MQFSLIGSEFNYGQLNASKVKVYLRTGCVEILEQHQDLLGKIENDVIEIESNNENQKEIKRFILQEAVFVVSTIKPEVNGSKTAVSVYSTGVKELNNELNLDAVIKEYEEKKGLLEALTDLRKAEENKTKQQSMDSTILLLKSEVEFLRRTKLIRSDFKG
uniref:ATP synthase CF1 epsilon subunit n=1 Tax=Neotessella volvocina TaxID=52559 RepID=A0A3G2R073_9STRA|nr:ATP synthase CF1 epsilon subunit [Neotessella volvocina]